MLKKLCLLLTVCLLLCGCANSQPQPTQAPATEDPGAATETIPETTETTVPETEPVPQTAEAASLADHVPAILTTLRRGDSVEVVGEYDAGNYVIKTEFGYGLVEKQLLRTEGQEPYQSWKGYAKWDAKIYDNYQLQGEAVKTLNTNEVLEVLEDLGCCFLVQTADNFYFIPVDSVSKYPIQYSSGSSGGADGGDISLSGAGIQRLSVIAQEGEVTGKATVLADGTLVVLGYFDRGDIFRIVTEPGFAPDREGFLTAYFDGLYAYVPMQLAKTGDGEPYEQWVGYARSNAGLFDNYLTLGAPVKTLKYNTEVQVLCDLGNSYLVSVDGSVGYMPKALVSETRLPVSSGGSGSGGGEWTPPAM